jgi:hypothetical protein
MRLRFGIAAAVLCLVAGPALAITGAGFDASSELPDTLGVLELEVGVDPCHSPPSLHNLGITKLDGQVGIGATACVYPTNDTSLLRLEWGDSSLCSPSDSIRHVANISSETTYDNTSDAGALWNGLFSRQQTNDRYVDTLYAGNFEVVDIDRRGTLTGSAAVRGVFDPSDLNNNSTVYGGWFVVQDSAGANSCALYGRNEDASGVQYGVYGENASTTGFGVYSDGRFTSTEACYQSQGPGDTYVANHIMSTAATGRHAGNSGTSVQYCSFEPPPEQEHGVSCWVDTIWITIYQVAATDTIFDLTLWESTFDDCGRASIAAIDTIEGTGGCQKLVLATNFSPDNETWYLSWDPSANCGNNDTRIKGIETKYYYQ